MESVYIQGSLTVRIPISFNFSGPIICFRTYNLKNCPTQTGNNHFTADTSVLSLDLHITCGSMASPHSLVFERLGRWKQGSITMAAAACIRLLNE